MLSDLVSRSVLFLNILPLHFDKSFLLHALVKGIVPAISLPCLFLSHLALPALPTYYIQ